MKIWKIIYSNIILNWNILIYIGSIINNVINNRPLFINLYNDIA